MTARSKSYLQGKFANGQKPTGTDFSDQFDSFVHKTEDSIAISKVTGLTDVLGQYGNDINYFSGQIEHTIEQIKGAKLTEGVILISPNCALFPFNNWSIEAYVKLTDITTTAFISNNGDGNPSIFITGGSLFISCSGVANAGHVVLGDVLNQDLHIVITYNGTTHFVYINGVAQTFIVDNVVNYSKTLESLSIGSYLGLELYCNMTLYLFRIYTRVLSSGEVVDHYNNSRPTYFISKKELGLILELHGDNVGPTYWKDSSSNNNHGVFGGVYDSFGNGESLLPSGGFLSVLPTVMYCAIGREFNLWFDSIIPNYGNKYIINVVAAKGYSSERSYRFTATIVENINLTIQVRDFDSNILESRLVYLSCVANDSGSGTKQLLFIGDSTTDSFNDVDYPVLPDGRTRYEMLEEIHTLIDADGGFTPLFLGLRGSDPYKHQARSGYPSSFFITNNISYPNPFWDSGIGDVNFKKYMDDNECFGGSDTIDFAFIQLGINDLKYGGSPTVTVNNIATLIEKILDPTHGYPSCKIILSITPFVGLDRTGWALHFPANSDYNEFVRNMFLLARLLVNKFDGSSAYPNVKIAPNMLWVDRKHGYPSELKNVSARSAAQEYEYTDSVHPSTSGYKQAADSYYSTLRGML